MGNKSPSAELLEMKAEIAKMAEDISFLRTNFKQLVQDTIADALHDSYIVGYHKAADSTAAYIARNMTDAQMFRNPGDFYKGDRTAKFQVLAYALSQVEKKGLYLEFGVFDGESINFIASHCSGQEPVYGFDSFEGLPEAWHLQYGQGHFSLQGEPPSVRENVRLVKGWFKDSLPPFLSETAGEAAFIHFDCDLYSSTCDVFRCLSDRIVPGTVMVFDEYFNYPGWEQGEFKAFQEFIDARGLSYRYIAYATAWTSVAIKIV